MKRERGKRINNSNNILLYYSTIMGKTSLSSAAVNNILILITSYFYNHIASDKGLDLSCASRFFFSWLYSKVKMAVCP